MSTVTASSPPSGLLSSPYGSYAYRRLPSSSYSPCPCGGCWWVMLPRADGTPGEDSVSIKPREATQSPLRTQAGNCLPW